MMKNVTRLASPVLVFVLCLALMAGCSGTGNEQTSANTQSSSTQKVSSQTASAAQETTAQGITQGTTAQETTVQESTVQETTAQATTVRETAQETSSVAINPAAGHALPIFSKLTTLKVAFPESPDAPAKSDWLVFQEMQKKTNVHLELQPIPTASYDDKKKIMLNTGDIPDIMYVWAQEAREFGPKGAFLNLSKYRDKYMPDYNAEMKDYRSSVQDATATDGNIYLFSEKIINSAAGGGEYIRSDILKKLSLSIPNTYDELYDVLSLVKKAYPDSAPWVVRSGAPTSYDLFLYSMSRTWDIHLNMDDPGMGFNSGTGKWEFQRTKEQYKKMLEFISKCYKAQILDNSFLSTPDQAFKQKLLNDQGFFAIDVIPAANNIQKLGRGKNPDFTLQLISPVADSKGLRKTYRAPDVQGGGMAISARVKNPEQVVEFMDYWIYSQDSKLLFNWGVKDKTYKVNSSGENELLISDMKQIRSQYGIQVATLVGVLDDSVSVTQTYTADKVTEFRMLNNKNAFFTDDPIRVWTPDEQDAYNQLKSSIKDYADTESLKFITGKRPFSDWDSYVKEINAKGVDKLVNLSNQAQARRNAIK